MKETLPLVSVIALCYNHSRFALECLESIRHQTYKNIQLIIIDDCSKDDSVAVIRSWIEKRSVECVFVAHQENIGLCKTLNEALSYAKGKYISMIATDDVWISDKIENQVKQMEELPEDVGVIYSDAWRMDEEGNLLQKFFENTHDFSTLPVGNVFASLLKWNFVPALTVLIRRSCYEKVGGYDEKLCYEDWDMWLRISQHYKFVFSPLTSAKYRIIRTSLSRMIFDTTNCKRLSTDFRIYSKCLISNEVDKEHRKIIVNQLTGIVEEMYKINCKERFYYLWKLLTCEIRPRALGMLAFSLCAIPYVHFYNFASWFGSLKQRLRSLTSV